MRLLWRKVVMMMFMMVNIMAARAVDRELVYIEWGDLCPPTATTTARATTANNKQQTTTTTTTTIRYSTCF